MKLPIQKFSWKRTKKTATSRKAIAPFRSKFEQSLSLYLNGIGCSFEYEPVRITYELHSKYIPDFVLHNGIIIEAKGRLLATDARKHRAIKNQHPSLDIRFVFMSLRTKVEKSRFNHREWCIKYGFMFSENIIPKDWINEKNKYDKGYERYLSEFR